MPAGPNPFANLMQPNLPPMNFTMPNMAQGSMPVGGLPPFPFMSPFPMPPPPIPPNLDTLTDEEIRALEGNERKHVEERIKVINFLIYFNSLINNFVFLFQLLRNIQLLLDASVSLMNQYSVITARLPIVPPPVIAPQIIPIVVAATTSSAQQIVEPIASTSKIIPSETDETIKMTEKIDETKIENLVRIEDVGSEEHIDEIINKNETISSSFNETNIIDAETNETANEIRRRRLEKFLKNENQSN